jgi:DNA-directed RNA polymerase specialized sigma24 family protein
MSGGRGRGTDHLARTHLARLGHLAARAIPAALVAHLPAMRTSALPLTRNALAADDRVPDTVVKAWSQFGRVQPRAWLFTILRNSFYSDRRRMSRELGDSDGTLVGTLAEKPAHDRRLHLADFLRAVRRLPEEQREALALLGALGLVPGGGSPDARHCGRRAPLRPKGGTRRLGRSRGRGAPPCTTPSSTI